MYIYIYKYTYICIHITYIYIYMYAHSPQFIILIINQMWRVAAECNPQACLLRCCKAKLVMQEKGFRSVTDCLVSWGIPTVAVNSQRKPQENGGLMGFHGDLPSGKLT